MKNKLLPAALLTCLSFGAQANYIDGNMLKAMSMAPVTDNEHLQFVGYVVGVIDSDERNTLCVDVPPNELTPVLDAVKQYLAQNPDKLNSTGNRLIVDALLPHYACQDNNGK